MNMYASRRKRLMESVKDNTLVLFFSSDNASTENKFNVNRNFYYLTGIDARSEILLMSKIGNKINEYLFILPYDEKEAKWVGGRLKDHEAKGISGIKDIRYADDFDKFVDKLVSKNKVTVLLDMAENEDILETHAEDFANRLSEDHEDVEFDDVFKYIAALRLIKDDYEIECIRKAIDVTRKGIESMMRNIHPDMLEMELEGIFDLELKKNGFSETSFKTIASSGIRSTILHYMENDHVIKDGEMFLQDLGATCNHYCADISRTYPVNGKFTPRQKELYNLVLDVQKLVEKNARPGVSIKYLNKLVVDYYKEELPKHGLKGDVFDYYYHGVSHQIGLDCHDLDNGMGNVLRPGMIISNEPGIYVESEKIGIRIEDDLLIKEDGCENLSSSIIKEAEDIESFMKK